MLKTSKLAYPLLLLLALLFSGCSQVVHPGGAIPVKMEVVGPLDAKKVVSFTNAVPDSKLTLVATQGSQKYFADYRHWTGSIVNQLEDELRKRGVQVKPQSEVGFRVVVESVRLFWGAFSQRCVVRARVDKVDGTWSKNYEGNDASDNFNQAIDKALYKLVASIMGDQDFRSAIR